ncbi:MAG: YihY/virulence factor BrkB family protein [Gemmataceae bacterium]
MSLTTIRLREAWNFGGLSLKELAIRTYRQIETHETLDRAAIIAFYAMTSLAPFLSFLLAISLGLESGFAAQLIAFARQFLPPEALTIVVDQIQKIQTTSPVGVLSFSFVVLLWSSSGISISMIDSTNAAYQVRDSRPFWRRRLLASALTLVEAILMIAAVTIVIIWPHLLRWLGLDSVATAAATVIQWIIVVIALLLIFAMTYYFAPDVKQEWEWITPGSALGVLVLIVSSLGLRLYFLYAAHSAETYGALAGVVLMMLWLYVAALALLVGAEINSVIEHAAPHGKAPGDKVSPQQASDMPMPQQSALAQ